MDDKDYKDILGGHLMGSEFDIGIANVLLELVARGKVIKFKEGEVYGDVDGGDVLEMTVYDKDWDDLGVVEPPAYISSIAFHDLRGRTVDPNYTAGMVAAFIKSTSDKVHLDEIKKYRERGRYRGQ